MAEQITGTGYVKVLNDRSVRGRKGPTTVWSMVVEHDDGEESPFITVNFGNKPPIDKGDYIEFTAEKNDRGYWSVTNDGKDVRRTTPPAKPSSTAAVTSGSGSSGAGASSTAGNPRQQSIVLQHSQEMAVHTVAMLLQADALPITKAQTKSGVAKRYQEIRAAINKLTRSFYEDASTDRILETVEDEGVINTKADAELPPAGAQTADSGEDE